MIKSTVLQKSNNMPEKKTDKEESGENCGKFEDKESQTDYSDFVSEMLANQRDMWEVIQGLAKDVEEIKENLESKLLFLFKYT